LSACTLKIFKPQKDPPPKYADGVGDHLLWVALYAPYGLQWDPRLYILPGSIYIDTVTKNYELKGKKDETLHTFPSEPKLNMLVSAGPKRIELTGES
jgi:hypothetical protein